MAWRIEYDSQVLRDFKKLDRTICKEIIGYLERRVAASENPRNFGKALREDKFGLWRYRVRDYRIICQIEDRHCVVLVVRIGHRSTIYTA